MRAQLKRCSSLFATNTYTKKEIWKPADSNPSYFRTPTPHQPALWHMGFDKNKLVLLEKWRLCQTLTRYSLLKIQRREIFHYQGFSPNDESKQHEQECLIFHSPPTGVALCRE